MTPDDCGRAASATATLIELIQAGTVAALPETVHRLEGAQIVFELLAQGEAGPALIERLRELRG